MSNVNAESDIGNLIFPIDFPLPPFLARMKEWLRFDKVKMTVKEALTKLNNLVDESDPDTDLPNIVHAFQTAELIRKEHPDLDWFHLTGLIHDLGKVRKRRRGKKTVFFSFFLDDRAGDGVFRGATVGGGGRHVPRGMRLGRLDRVQRHQLRG